MPSCNRTPPRSTGTWTRWTHGLVLSDASPLVGLARVDGLIWLPTLFGSVHLPEDVWAELTPGRGHADEAPLHMAHGPTPTQPELPDPDEGEGETACIRHALAQSDPVLLLMDERAGRAVAMARGLRVVGTAASAREVFARLHASDFRISAEVIRTVLCRVGELS